MQYSTKRIKTKCDYRNSAAGTQYMGRREKLANENKTHPTVSRHSLIFNKIVVALTNISLK